MPPRLSDAQARRLRIRAQRLTGPRSREVVEVVRQVLAIPAQDLRASRLAVRPRSHGLGIDAVVDACNRDRSVVRTWAMRGTLHMVTAEDVAWLVGLLGPQVAARDRRRRLELGLGDALVQRALAAMPSVLSGGPRTRAELVAQLARRRVRLDPATNAAAHLCLVAAARGVICRGPDQPDDEPTYVLLDDWIGNRSRRQPSDPLTELAHRYLAAYSPAGVEDLAGWAGIAVGQARTAFTGLWSKLVEVEVGGRPAWMLSTTKNPDAAPGGKPAVRLLGAFDPYLLGYAGRDLALPSAHAHRIQAGGGWIHPALTVDGLVVGTWRQPRRRPSTSVEVQPFKPLGRRIGPLIEAEVSDLGRFLGESLGRSP